MRYRAMLNVFLATALAAGMAQMPVAGAHDDGPAPASAATIDIVDNQYLPDTVSVDAGETVQWDVSATALEEHTVTADDGLFDSGLLLAGQTFSRVFNIEGTFSFHCEIHPDEMSGSVVVAAAVGDTAPEAPTNVVATAGAESATVTWSPPATDGGSPITGYTVTANDGTTTEAPAGATTATITGLTEGQFYTFTVTATNAVGTSAASVASNAVVPTAGAPEATAPDAPSEVVATAGNGSATVTWSPPTTDGGSPITGYTVTASEGGATATVAGDATTATVTGLTNGTSYTFTVTATNAAGTSSPSEASNAVTPSLIAVACPPGEVPDSNFADVGGNVHAASIECIVWYGITLGAAPGQYDPEVQVTRDQMASFIARMITSAGVTLAPASDQGFTDIAGNVHAERINQLAAVGVSLGSSPTTYAPGEVVPREQMATFLVRAYQLVAGETLTASRDYFSDDDGSVHEDNINNAAEAEFTSGTSATEFSPRQPVRRDQMGSFLARTLSALAEAGHGTTP